MKRRLFAAVWIAGAAVPVLVAAVFVAGCCALPFHSVIHKLMPLCNMAVQVMRGDHATHGGDEVPVAPEKQKPLKRIATRVPTPFRLAALTSVPCLAHASSTTEYRSFITLGAIRCDRDVGLHVLDATFLI